MSGNSWNRWLLGSLICALPTFADDVLGVPAATSGQARMSGEECPTAGFLCGQDTAACGTTQWYFYSDLEFYNTSNPDQEQRVRCEDFPPPDVANLTEPIGVISWLGAYVDINSNGCTKQNHTFRIRFYPDTGSGHTAPNTALMGFEEVVTATAVDTGETVQFGSGTPTTLWSFTAVLSESVSMGTGWFSICGLGTADCFHLWPGAGDGEGNHLIYAWWEQGGAVPGTPITTFCDLHYCFSQKLIGSCCLDCENGGQGECLAPYAKQQCDLRNGRFVPGGTCAPGEFNPPCGLGVGACCYNDGTCAATTCAACGDYPNVWLGVETQCVQCCTVAPGDPNFPNYALEGEPLCGPGYVDTFNAGCSGSPFGGCSYCRGDCNCDGVVDFNDISAFVAVLGGQPPADCRPCRGDFTCDCLLNQQDWEDWLGEVCCYFPNCDCNGDGVLDFDDVDCLIEVWSSHWACPPIENCDIDGDGVIDFADINPFVELLSSHPGPCQPPRADRHLFSPIAPGVHVYGESGTFMLNGNEARDEDWYEYDASAGGGYRKFTVQVRAEFDVQVIILHAGECDPVDPNNPNDPNDNWRVKTGEALACAGGNPAVPDLTLETQCVPAGVYWFVVMPQTFSGVPCGADYWIELGVENCTPIDVGPCPPGAYQEVDGCGETTFSGCWGDPSDPNYPEFEMLPAYVPSVPFTICGKVFTYRGANGSFARDSDWYEITLQAKATIEWAVTTEVSLMACIFLGYTTWPIPPTECDDLYFWTAAIFPAGTTPTVFSNGLQYAAGTYPFVVSPALDADNSICYGYPCMGPEHDYRIDVTITNITCPGLCGLAIPEGEPPCGPEYVDTYNGGCDAATFHATNVVLGTTGHCGQLGTFTVGGQPTRDHDWWKVTLTGTANARLKIGLRSEVNLNLELYGGLDPNNPNCAARMMLDWYRIDACEATASVYTPCLLNTMGGGTGVYYIRIYTTESGVSCAATAGNTYKLTVALDQSGCTLCALNCTGGLDDPCQDDPNDPETNDPCNDPNVPGNAMAYPSGNYPQYGAKQCGRISTFAGAGDSLWVDRDFFSFTMPANKTKLYIRARAQFRMTLRLFDTSCTPIIDASGVQRMAAWDRACSLSSVQNIAGLTAGTTYWAEIVYGNGKTGSGLQEWFEGLPCSTGANTYEIELAAGT